jgi:transposase, IS30 family
MPDKASYQQLQPEERLAIASLRLQDVSIRAMALILGRSPATISRELMRNSSATGYASVPAEARSTARLSAGRRPVKLCLQGLPGMQNRQQFCVKPRGQRAGAT